jgi:hypothetical protein
MVKISFDDLLLAFEFVSSAPPMENAAYVSLDTGEILWTSGLGDTEDEVPDDVETSGRFIAVPHKNDLDLGRNLALRFVAKVLPTERERVHSYFAKKGAYAKFKALLESAGALERWYTFETDSVRVALTEWCSGNELAFLEGENHSEA